MEALDLASQQSILEHRNHLLQELPNMLDVVGADEQIALLDRGRYGEVVSWFTGHVSVGGHGANAGDFGLTENQTRLFNPYAQQHGLMAPTRLWRPGDNLPEGAQVGDIVRYSVTPDFEAQPKDVKQASVTIGIDATVDGTIGRVDTMLGTAAHSKDASRWWRGRGHAAMLTGMRAVKPAEGNAGLYRQFLPEGVPAETPVEVAFPSATDATLAILQQRCTRFVLIHEVEDPLHGLPRDNKHPALGERAWIARYYDAVEAKTGKKLLITVVNGEPITASGQELNRSKREPAPKAGETLQDYLTLRLSGVDAMVNRKIHMRELLQAPNVNFAISYAHLGRIGAELQDVINTHLPGAIGRASLVGNMPQQATWSKLVDGWKHNGGTLGFKEIYPYIKALNALLGLAADDLRMYS